MKTTAFSALVSCSSYNKTDPMAKTGEIIMRFGLTACRSQSCCYRYDRRIEAKLREFIQRMSKILAIYKRLQKLEAEERTRLSWYARLWRRYQKPSALVLNQLSELRAENVLDIIEDALGGSLANKQQKKFRQQMFKASIENQQPSKVKPLNSSADRVAKQSGRQHVTSTACRAPAGQSVSATRKNDVLMVPGQQSHMENTQNSLSAGSKQRAAAAHGLSIGDAASRPAVLIQRSSEFELQEVVVHRTAPFGATDHDRLSNSTESSPPLSPSPSPPPSPPPEKSHVPPFKVPTVSAVVRHPPTGADSVNIRALLKNAGCSSTSELNLDKMYSGTSLQDHATSPTTSGSFQLTPTDSHTIPSSHSKTSTEQAHFVIHSSISPRSSPVDIVSRAAAIAASTGSRTFRAAAPLPAKTRHAPPATAVQVGVLQSVPVVPGGIATVGHSSIQGEFEDPLAKTNARLPTPSAPNDRKKNGRLDQV
jgi:hypothetical protein